MQAWAPLTTEADLFWLRLVALVVLFLLRVDPNVVLVVRFDVVVVDHVHVRTVSREFHVCRWLSAHDGTEQTNVPLSCSSSKLWPESISNSDHHHLLAHSDDKRTSAGLDVDLRLDNLRPTAWKRAALVSLLIWLAFYLRPGTKLIYASRFANLILLSTRALRSRHLLGTRKSSSSLVIAERLRDGSPIARGSSDINCQHLAMSVSGPRMRIVCPL